MKKFKRFTSPAILCALLFVITSCDNKEESRPNTLKINNSTHPSLILTQDGVAKIKAELGNMPIFSKELQTVKNEVDAEIALGINTPVPKDYSGGYTHERHKTNFFIMRKAGVLYQLLEDEKYAKYVRDMLFQYEDMYKNLPPHPQTRSYARGKLFWQCLNDSNWLVYVSQAYDCIYNYLSAEEREKLETNLFRPFADYISIENPQFFNRVHNHSTWGNAAVGMIGLVMDDEELVNRALYGIKNDKLDASAKDNDGGFIKNEEGKAGFLANLEEPFSPDGYYTEGPYYQRYAMYPFLVFAEGLQNLKPELKIFEHKDSVLIKSVHTLLNLTDADGEFFPLNDAQKGMSFHSRELVTAVDIAYHYGGKDPELLSIARKQGKVLLDDTGLSVALGIKNGKDEEFNKKSIKLTDGSNGKKGGLSVLRSGNQDFSLVFKYSAQGLSHGHYDKLSFLLNEDGDEVIQDYGMGRFVNIEQKGGGNYLKENTTWAKQTIAHNTVTVNESSHFNGKYEIGSKHHSNLYLFDANEKSIQLVSAKDTVAYPGTEIHRTMVVITDENFEKPYVLDIMRLTSNENNQYDLPYYFIGQLIDTNFEYNVPKSLKALGTKNGYQHLYLEGLGSPSEGNTKISWLIKGRFYTLTSALKKTDELLFTRIGANDPDFNLRRDASILFRRKNTKNTLFVSTIESHGGYSPVSEFAVNTKSTISEIKILLDTEDYIAIRIVDVYDNTKDFIMAINNASENEKHILIIDNREYQWTGAYYFK